MSFSALYTKPTAADRDLATLSNYQDIRTTHIDLQWTIDWDAKTIGGQATLSFEATKDVDCAILDTSFLNIQGVEVGGNAAVSVLGMYECVTDKATGVHCRQARQRRHGRAPHRQAPQGPRCWRGL